MKCASYISILSPSFFFYSSLTLFILSVRLLFFYYSFYTAMYCRILSCFHVLHCTVLYHTVQYHIVSDCTVLYCNVLHYIVLYCTVLYCTVTYCTLLYCTGSGRIQCCGIRSMRITSQRGNNSIS